MLTADERARYVLAFDTANEVIALGLGRLIRSSQEIIQVASKCIPAHRASNTRLLPEISALLEEVGIERKDIAAVCCGRGPGSFTGVRICIATAKGIAQALELPLIGVSTLDAIAWDLHAAGYRGDALVVADAMRKEVYPVPYCLEEDAVHRLAPDTVIKATLAAQTFDVASQSSLSESDSDKTSGLGDHDREMRVSHRILAGDALVKYQDLFAHLGTSVPESLWYAQGSGLMAALKAEWRAGEVDPFDEKRHDPALMLPVYTRLSDAEENERARMQVPSRANLHTGVQNPHEITYRPLVAGDAALVAALDAICMPKDAWSESLMHDDIVRRDRIWWGAFNVSTQTLIGYTGGWVCDGQLQILKVGCHPDWRRHHVAHELIGRVSADARDLGAQECTLEVRASNEPAQALYRKLGLNMIGVRPKYYHDGEDAKIFTGPLAIEMRDVAGMELQIDRESKDSQQAVDCIHPLILAIETSCDETAAAIVDGNGEIIADVVASQIDFHARFGGVVPEIASRKHVEAICGVTQTCLEKAAEHLGVDKLDWSALDGVAVTYAPGLVGALVVGVAYAKAAAWACDVAFLRVNHLEGHLYANKLAQPDIEPPMVVSLVSGGHTMLVSVRDWGDYQVLGSTIDDAVGEAFDKVAKALGLGYPGGPIISRLAQRGNPKAIAFPRAMMHSGDLRFSLSGLKTAVITYIQAIQQRGEELPLEDIAASFQAAVIDVQVAKAISALEAVGAREFCVGGGVAANPALREAYERACSERGIRLTLPPMSACTDNAAMIALVALARYRQGLFSGLDTDAQAHTNLEEPY